MLRTMALLGLLLAGCAAPKHTGKQTQVVMNREIMLLDPSPAAGATINQALADRRSSREFAAEPLSLEALSGVLWASSGVNRPDGHLTAPSALGIYPVQVYAFFADGVYLYQPEQKRLVRVHEGDHRRLTAMQEFAYAAPLNLVYVADLGKYEGRNIAPEQARYLCGQDAAGYAENVNLYAAGHGLHAITRGSTRSAELLELLRLDPQRWLVALAQTVGKAPAEPKEPKGL